MFACPFVAVKAISVTKRLPAATRVGPFISVLFFVIMQTTFKLIFIVTFVTLERWLIMNKYDVLVNLLF